MTKQDYSKFVCNIYDPRLPDSDDKLVAATAEPEKKANLLRFIRDMLQQYDIGEPCETYAASFKKLKQNNIVGLYRTERTKDLGSLKLFGDFTAKRQEPEEGSEAEEAPKKFQMNFRKRPKQMYKFPNVQVDKSEVPTIDDYVPPTPIKDD